MVKAEPLNEAEELLWRALMRIVLSLPRRLDADLVRTVGVTANEYLALMCLSEAPRRELRMTDLARATGLSASRMTRLVADLEHRGLVTKRASAEDRRGYEARLTPAGLAKLRKAWPAHLASARQRVFDHVDPDAIADAAALLTQVANQLETDR